MHTSEIKSIVYQYNAPFKSEYVPVNHMTETEISDALKRLDKHGYIAHLWIDIDHNKTIVVTGSLK